MVGNAIEWAHSIPFEAVPAGVLELRHAEKRPLMHTHPSVQPEHVTVYKCAATLPPCLFECAICVNLHRTVVWHVMVWRGLHQFTALQLAMLGGVLLWELCSEHYGMLWLRTELQVMEVELV